MFLSERYKQRKYNEGKAEAHALWRDWNTRRMEAEAEGKPFDEPPPDEK